MKIHIVQKGDTLWKIAKKYGVNFEELKKLNTQLSNPDMIMPGMKIKVPGSGGSIKKEAPIGGIPETKVSMGAKKEMPIAEHPFAKEKPITLPVVEAPKQIPIKEAPQVEVPKQLPKMVSPQVEAPKQLPKMVSPQVEAPKQLPKMVSPQMEIPKQLPKMVSPQMELPKQLPKMVSPLEEMPVKPYAPKMPKPIMPNLAAQQQAPQLPPKPVNILPQVKPIAHVSPESIESDHIKQGGFYQPMYPYQPHSFYPVSPVMPGTGFPGGYPQTMGYPQVQGAATMPMYQAQAMPMHQMPHYGLAGVESHGFEESSSFMPMHQMPYTNPAFTQVPGAQMPAPVMGVQEMGQHQLPLQPTYTAPAMQPAYGYPQAPCPPFLPPMIPISPVMPGSGFCGPMLYEQMPYGYPQMGVMPQVQGVMEESPGMAQMPLMPTQSQMPIMPTQTQMPIMPTQTQMPILPSQSQMPLMPTQVMPMQGVKEDCGCGSGAPQMFQGAYNPGFGAPGMYDMGVAPMYRAPYGQQYGNPQMGYPMTGVMNPYMSPYGPGPLGGQALEMPRSFEESDEYED
ncbi:SafA/ExsA family spore coat assembly protein [Bacillus sp. JJ1773]|uniref:SafA/ExsA family spore coat assembly protein n=1 Tax=Bacillus sp. JJ1773 TaxID=3122965 RepID=UPI002FFF18F7